MAGGVGAANAAAAVDVMNQVLVNAQQKSLDVATKVMKTTVEARLGNEAGKGAAVDVVG